MAFQLTAVCSHCNAPIVAVWIKYVTRNTLDFDQSNYSSRIIFSQIPIEFGQTGISAIRSTVPENPTVEPNMKWIGRPLAEIWPFEIYLNESLERSIGRSVAGRPSVLNIYFCLHWSHILLFATLGTSSERLHGWWIADIMQRVSSLGLGQTGISAIELSSKTDQVIYSGIAYICFS